MKRLLLPVLILLISQCLSYSQSSIDFPSLIPPSAAPAEADSPHSVSEWRMDSTWSWYWNTGISDWQRIERAFMTVNGSGMLLSTLTLTWNYTLSEWVNFYRVRNEYYSDHTTRSYSVTETWNPTDQVWMEEFHANYNSEGDLTEAESKDYNAQSNAYVHGQLTNITYSPNSIQTLIRDLEIPSLAWKNAERYTRETDGSENITSALAEVWNDAISSWQNMEWTTATYNSQNQKTEEIYRTWHLLLGDWINVIKLTHEYNTSAWHISSHLYSWNASLNSWDNYARVQNHYDEFGKIILAESSEWDNTLQTWTNDQKEVFTYHPNSVQHEQYRFLWIPSLSAYMELERTAWNDQGNETEYVSREINMSTFEYYEGSKTLTTWTDGLMQEKLAQQLVVPSMDWKNYWKQTNTYDGNRNNTQELTEYYDDGTQAWRNSGKEDHFFSSYIGIDEKQGLNGLCVFQNPLSPGETITCPGLEPEKVSGLRLLTVQGQCVVRWDVQRNGTYTIPSSVNTGIYLLEIIYNNLSSVTGKVMVVK